MWKPFPSRRVLKSLRGSPKGKARKGKPKEGQYLVAVGLDRYKVSEPDTGRCNNEEVVPRRGVDTRRCACKDAGPRRGVDLVGVPHQLEKGTSASKDAGP